MWGDRVDQCLRLGIDWNEAQGTFGDLGNMVMVSCVYMYIFFQTRLTKNSLCKLYLNKDDFLSGG